MNLNTHLNSHRIVLAILSEILLSLVYALHLVGMNLAGGGPVAAVWLQWRARTDQRAQRAVRGLIGFCLAIYTVSMVLGLAAGYLMWNLGYSPFYYDLLNRLSSKIFWGIAELVVSLICLAIPWLLLKLSRERSSGLVAGINIFLFLFGSLNLLYHFPLLLAVVGKIVATPNAFGGVIDNAAFRELAFTPEILSRSLHFVLASLTVGGMAASYYYIREFDEPGETVKPEEKSTAQAATSNSSDTADAPDSEGHSPALSGVQDEEVESAEKPQSDVPKHKMFTDHRAKFGVWLALIATTLQIPTGIWIALSIPAVSQQSLMGQNSWASVFFAIAIFAALGLMHQLIMQAINGVTRIGLLRATYNLLLIILLMSSVWLKIRPRPEGNLQMLPRSAAVEMQDSEAL